MHPTREVVEGCAFVAVVERRYLTAGVRRRPNLTVRGDVTIDGVLFDGTTAAGVAAADGRVYRAGEVILSGGSYGSAAILPPPASARPMS